VGAVNEGTRGPGERDLDAVVGRVTAGLLRQSHLMRPDDVPGALAEAARPLGVAAAQVYLADLQRRHLAPLPAGQDQDAHALPIDSTLAGSAYQTVSIQWSAAPSPGPSTGAGAAGETYQVWVPLIDGTERLGVLCLTVADVSEAMLDRYRTLATLVGIMIMAKSSYSDTYARVQRTRQMALQAELVWAFLAPRTFATDRVLVAATLEPAYEAGGDAFDYSLHGDHLHVSIFDALGHDLSAGILASVGLASCRSTRRSGGSLTEIAAGADDAISGFFGGERFVTALLCDLDLASGQFTWIPCGHPPPLLISGRTITELARTPRPPLGLTGHHDRKPAEPHDNKAAGPQDDATASSLYAETLQPGDRLLLYTDGVTEGRAADGTPFGLERLVGFIRDSAALLPAPETMRRLNHEILDYQGSRLRDDATAVLIEWQPADPGRGLTP
jgi:hypothetical protein